MTDPDIRDERNEDGTGGRFITEVDGHTAIVRYTLEGDDRIRLTHTDVPPPVEGRGVGSSLAKFALESAAEQGRRVWPDCPFIGAYIRRHPEYIDNVDPAFPRRAELESTD